MPAIPFIGRLFWREYLALLGSFVLIGLEAFIRVITLALPERLLRWLYGKSGALFNFLSSPQSRKARKKNRATVNPIAHAHDFLELCELFGYYAEEHVVQTRDGYLLGLHRLAWRHGEEDKRVNSGSGSIQKKVVYMHHGLMMNSEVWVCLSEKERCLPYTLVDKGYDVWLGNNRGNKYSKKSVRHSPNSTAFWDFSMDQFAFHDIPDSVAYVLSTTQQPSLSYVGFSQGTAQAFATLSIHPTLNDKVDVFLALAPAMSPPGLNEGLVNTLVKTSPEVLFLAFGRRSLLSSATMWQAILYPPIFVRFIDMSLSFLFGWHTQNISPHQKLAAYPHLYSFTSTKCVVHWFQIIRNGTFQMFDDEVKGALSWKEGSRYYKVPKFPTKNIKTPIVLLYGGSDSLVDINVMLKELPKHTVVQEIPHYEHLDFLWASDIERCVFPHVFETLDFYARSVEKKELPTAFGKDRPSSMSTQPPSYSEDEAGKVNGPVLTRRSHHEPQPGQIEMPATASNHKHRSSYHKHQSRDSHSRLLPPIESLEASHSTLAVSETSSRPEGWWSSDEAGGSDSPTAIKSMGGPNVHEPNNLTHSRPKSRSKTSLEFRTETAKIVADAINGLEGVQNLDASAVNLPREKTKRKDKKKRAPAQ